MIRTFMRRSLLALTALPLMASASLANPTQPAQPSALTQALRAYEYVPASRAELLNAFPDALDRLSQIALDSSLPALERTRALSFLSFFSNPDISAKESQRVRQVFERLAQSQPNDSALEREIRAEAVYALGRSFGTRADKALVLTLERHALDGDALMSGSAVRALRWVDAPEAELALQRLQAKVKPEQQRLVKLTKERRLQRLQQRHR